MSHSIYCIMHRPKGADHWLVEQPQPSTPPEAAKMIRELHAQGFEINFQRIRLEPNGGPMTTDQLEKILYVLAGPGEPL